MPPYNFSILIFFTFEFYFSINNVQEELHNISVLRKQLEDDILANWNLRRVLESQIKANRREGKEEYVAKHLS